jgi:hypothetical protein
MEFDFAEGRRPRLPAGKAETLVQTARPLRHPPRLQKVDQVWAQDQKRLFVNDGR